MSSKEVSCIGIFFIDGNMNFVYFSIKKWCEQWVIVRMLDNKVWGGVEISNILSYFIGGLAILMVFYIAISVM